ATADTGVTHPLTLPAGGRQRGAVRAPPRVASTAARIAALREAGAAAEAHARGSIAAAEPVTAGALADRGGAAGTAGIAPSGAALGVRFAATSYDVTDTAPAARVVVRRTGSADNDIRFVWWTMEDSAKADVDFAPLGVRTEVIPRGADNITIYIPIISNPLRHQTATFFVALGAPGTWQSDTPAQRASVTIERGG
ncbi:MAG: Calx-beta domain-containing protein, partial [Steroidobacteraceae bacterium]